jgi:hypothetical protein
MLRDASDCHTALAENGHCTFLRIHVVAHIASGLHYMSPRDLDRDRCRAGHQERSTGTHHIRRHKGTHVVLLGSLHGAASRRLAILRGILLASTSISL